MSSQINIGHEIYGNTFFCNQWTEKKIDLILSKENVCNGIKPGTYLKSLNNAYTAEFQHDGTIAVYVIRRQRLFLLLKFKYFLEFFKDIGLYARDGRPRNGSIETYRVAFQDVKYGSSGKLCACRFKQFIN